MQMYKSKEEEEEHNVPEDFKTSADLVDESHGGSQLEEHNIELSLGGQDNLMNKDDAEKEAAVGDEDAMDCEESKGDGPQDVQWNLDGDSYMDVGGENFLRPCNLGDVDMDVQDEQEEQHEEGFTISPKGDNLEAVHSANLLEGMETADVPFTTGLHIRDNSSGEFLVSRVDARTVPAVSSFLSNGNKREIGHENDISHNSLNLSNKRLRTDEQWDKSSDFDTCMEQMQHWMDKARMLYAAKDQACGDSSMHQQVLLHELQRRDTLIEHLQKAKFEEQQKRQMEVYRLERELYLMENLLDGYRKALKETNRTFAEYRARCPLPDEPLYKDVTGSGGLVLSTREIEKLRLKQEEEDRLNRLLTENKIKDFEAGWIRKFDAHRDAVSLLSDKLTNAENEVKLLKELCNRKVSAGTPECVPNESGMSSQDTWGSLDEYRCLFTKSHARDWLKYVQKILFKPGDVELKDG
ncbi:hypothetical protein GOBAR_DD33844 [Gossypium barbadense]|nr:hypothetical protein GOBAR_DD33844 [Gossypium barbadense]